MDAADGGRQVAGQIKWFDPVKGFGFIVSDEGGPDILLHANVLRSFGQNSIADGSRVVVEMFPTPRGLQATALLALAPPAEDAARPIAELAAGNSVALDTLPFQPARVKWFDKAKGFGFATVFGESADVFLHFEVLRHGGFADLASGEAVALRVLEGGRGLMAAQIASWDRGIPQAEGAGDAPPEAKGRAILRPLPGAIPGADGAALKPADAPTSPVGAQAVATPPLIAAEQP